MYTGYKQTNNKKELEMEAFRFGLDVPYIQKKAAYISAKALGISIKRKIGPPIKLPYPKRRRFTTRHTRTPPPPIYKKPSPPPVPVPTSTFKLNLNNMYNILCMD